MGRLTDDARAIFDAAVRSVQADALLGRLDLDRISRRPLHAYRRLFVVGMGKASMAMASVLETRIEKPLRHGFVVVPRGYGASLPDRFCKPSQIQVAEAGHPLPDSGSVAAARTILHVADEARKEDLVLVLISGGGSALCADFLGGITLHEAQETFELLLKAGIDIHAMNTVRKHLSTIGGGRLAAAAYPADVAALVISDVVGDDVSVIASGPTSGDPTTFEDAMAVVQDAGLWERVPTRVRSFLRRELENPQNESLKPGAPELEAVANHVIGTNDTAVDAAAASARSIGYTAGVAERGVTGEARDVGRRLVGRFLSGSPEIGSCMICGGETTVTVKGNGRGGRNQEAALAAVVALEGWGEDVVFLSGGTDGVDGPTDAAGAVAATRDAARGRELGLDPAALLADNDSYVFFERTGGLLKTGPTHTNVMDIHLLLI